MVSTIPAYSRLICEMGWIVRNWPSALDPYRFPFHDEPNIPFFRSVKRRGTTPYDSMRRGAASGKGKLWGLTFSVNKKNWKNEEAQQGRQNFVTTYGRCHSLSRHESNFSCKTAADRSCACRMNAPRSSTAVMLSDVRETSETFFLILIISV